MASTATIVLTVNSAGAITGLQGATQAMNSFGSSSSNAQGKLRTFERGIGSFRRALSGVQAALGGFGLAELVKDIVRVNVEFTRVRYALLAGSDSAAAAAADFDWLQQQTIKMGAPLDKVGLEFAKLSAAAKGTALQGQPVRDVFTGITKASMAMGLDMASTQRVFMALTQMLSKGRVQAEEARQQFGEHLPGGFKLLAEAAGFSIDHLAQFSKALQKGQVDATKMMTALPAVIEKNFGPVIEKVFTESPQKAFASFKATISNLEYAIGQAGFMKEFVGMILDVQNALGSDKGKEGIRRLGEGLANVMKVVRTAVDFIVQHMQAFSAAFSGMFAGSLVIAIKGFIGWMGKLAGSATLVEFILNPWVLLAGTIAVATGALVGYGDGLLTIGNNSATITDWIVAGFLTVRDVIVKAKEDFVEFMKSDDGQALVNNLINGWNTFKAVIGGVWDLIGGLTAVIVGVGKIIWDATTPIADAIYLVFSGLGDVIGSLIDGLTLNMTNFNKKVATDTKASTDSAKFGFVDFFDLIVGGCLMAIKGVGLIVKALGTLLGTLVELGSRTGLIFGGMTDAAIAFATRDAGAAKAAAAKIAEGVKGHEKIADMWKDLGADSKNFMDQMNSDSDPVWHIFKNGFAAADKTKAAFDDVHKSVGNIVSGKGGPGIAQLLSGLDAVGQRAAKMTLTSRAAAKARQEEQDRMVRDNAEAYAAMNAGVDRDAHQDLSGLNTKKARKTIEDRIRDFRNQQATSNNLIDDMQKSVATGVLFTPENVKAIDDAQKALKAANIELSYGQAEAHGGLPKRLADAAFAASLAAQETEKYKKAIDDTLKNNTTIEGYKQQTDMAKDLSVSTEDFNAMLAGQNQLRSAGFRLTYAEATAQNTLGEAINPVADALARSAVEQYKWNKEAERTTSIAAELRGFKQTGDDFQAFGLAAGAGDEALDRLGVTLAAQRDIMKMYGDDVWNATRLQDANTASLYKNKIALGLAGGDAAAYGKMINSLAKKRMAIQDPKAASNFDINNQAALQGRQLDEGFKQVEGNLGKNLIDTGGDQDRIKQVMAQFSQDKDAYLQAKNDLIQTTKFDLLQNSNDFFDAFTVSVHDFGLKAMDIGGQLHNTFDDAFNGMTDALTNFVMTGKLSFRDFAKSVIKDITAMIIKFLMFQALKDTLGGPLGFLFAGGGVMSSGGPMPLNKYANGGIANSPQMAIFGEGRSPEAYVPLPDGRSIPVTMKAPSSGLYDASERSAPNNVTIQVNSNVTTNGAGSSGNGGTDARFAEQLSKKMAAEMRSNIVDVVQNEMRPGGAFNPIGSNRSRF